MESDALQSDVRQTRESANIPVALNHRVFKNIGQSLYIEIIGFGLYTDQIMVNIYHLHFATQLRQHLRAMRKSRNLTQAQLGAIVGVSQARIAEIEANPGVVSLDQLMQLFSALDVKLALCDMSSTQGQSEQLQKSVETNNQQVKSYQATDTAKESASAHKNTDNVSGLSQIRKLLGHSRKGSW